MILVDSSVWIDFFRDVSSEYTERLVELIVTRRLAIADLVLAEVLQGCRSEAQARSIAGRMMALHPVVVCDHSLAILAASHYRALSARGITVRKTMDVLIATRCIVDGIPLLFSDRDFLPFVEHLGLRSALDLPGTVQ